MYDEPPPSFRPPTLSDQLPERPKVTKPRHFSLPLLTGICACLAIVAAGLMIYFGQHGEVAELSQEVKSLRTSIVDLQKNVDRAESLVRTNDVNESANELPAGGLGLVFNRVTFVLPPGWVKATAPNFNRLCMGNAYTTTPCLDVTGIIPSSLNTGPGNYEGAVIKTYRSNGMSAKDWFLNDFRGAQPGKDDETSSAMVDNYDTYYFLQKGDTFIDMHYVIVASDMVTHVYSRLSGPKYNIKTKADSYTAQYSNAIKTFVNSINIGQ